LRILTGDIGGTSTRLAIASVRADSIRIDQHTTFPSRDYASLSDIISDFQPAQQSPLDAAAFGVAGPVKQGVSRITNLPWQISQRQLAKQLQLDAVYLLNDLEALAWGIDKLAGEELVSLQSGAAGTNGNRAVIAAGTGLGQAGVCFDGVGYRPFATEGGHTDFAPYSEQDWLLLKQLQHRYTHVSWERLLSGPGLVTLYEFVLQQHKAPVPDWLIAADQDPAARITRSALQQSDEHCVETLNWFVQLYGREAGNVALKMNATGGFYLGGGIAPKILPALKAGAFIETFLDKGRMRPLLESMSVQVICSQHVALKGLASYALNAATA
jgi:glucokinase